MQRLIDLGQVEHVQERYATELTEEPARSSKNHAECEHSEVTGKPTEGSKDHAECARFQVTSKPTEGTKNHRECEHFEFTVKPDEGIKSHKEFTYNELSENPIEGSDNDPGDESSEKTVIQEYSLQDSILHEKLRREKEKRLDLCYMCA